MKPRHGHTVQYKSSRTFTAWMNMRARCSRKSFRQYADYGGRGITVCERWKLFENFLSDMGEVPVGHSLDRINNDGNYEPGNCRWATKAEQVRNSRNNRIVEFMGEKLCVRDWATRFGLHPTTITYRLRTGWSIERALTTKGRS